MRDVVVLCYHALSERWPAALSTTPARFKEQLECLIARGYRSATFIEAITDPPADRTFAVTFDDAYRSVLERARPIMDQLGVRGTVFVPTDWPGRAEPMRWHGIDRWVGGPYEHEMWCLNWSELRDLASIGWEIASHTCSHPHLTQIDDERLADELVQSRLAVEENLRRPCSSLAYPYGDVDERVVDAAEAAGYAFAAALPKHRSSRRHLDYPRVGVYHRDDLRRFKLKVSPLVRRLRGHLA